MRDFLDREINLYDIVLVIRANGEMDVALVVNIANEYGLIYPIIRGFDNNGELRKKDVIYKKNTIFIVNNSVPSTFYKKRLEFSAN